MRTNIRSDSSQVHVRPLRPATQINFLVHRSAVLVCSVYVIVRKHQSHLPRCSSVIALDAMPRQFFPFLLNLSITLFHPLDTTISLTHTSLHCHSRYFSLPSYHAFSTLTEQHPKSVFYFGLLIRRFLIPLVLPDDFSFWFLSTYLLVVIPCWFSVDFVVLSLSSSLCLPLESFSLSKFYGTTVSHICIYHYIYICLQITPPNQCCHR